MKKPIDPAKIDRLEKIAEWMDSKFVIPGTSINFGLDSLIGFIPVIGDSATLVTTLFFMARAHAFRLPHHLKAIMLWNLFIDWIIGLIPFLGDIFDIGWKANNKNVALIRKYVDKHNNSIIT